MSAAEVLAGRRPWWVDAADCLGWLASLPEDSVDLVVCSPPYEDCRTYGVDFSLKGQAWVDWMVVVFRACRRVCKGLVACVCEGKTEGYRWSATPALLMADLHRAGFHLRKPPAFHRVGIPGGGGPDWWRNDYEWVVCTTRGGKLPWSDNTACGHPPKWAPGGEMSHRLPDGARVNQWGGRETSGGQTRKNGGRQPTGRPSHVIRYKKDKRPKDKQWGGDEIQHYTPPDLANPGNFLYGEDPGDVLSGNAGKGHMGSDLAHDSEAPYPEWLVAPFVLSFCPPGGVVCDPFSGSGTTGAVAVRWGRRFVGCDLRGQQAELARRRIAGVTPELFV